jgi:hypothetical protein
MKAPAFLVSSRMADARAALGKGGRHMPIVQAVAFGLYAFFFNMQKFNKAIAMMLFACFGVVFAIPAKLIRPFQLLWACVASTGGTVRVWSGLGRVSC